MESNLGVHFPKFSLGIQISTLPGFFLFFSPLKIDRVGRWWKCPFRVKTVEFSGATWLLVSGSVEMSIIYKNQSILEGPFKWWTWDNHQIWAIWVGLPSIEKCWYYIIYSTYIYIYTHTRKLTWNLKMPTSERKHIFQWSFLSGEMAVKLWRVG